MKLTQGRPARSAALAAQRVSIRTSVYGHMSVYIVAWCSTAITMLRSIFLTEGLDGAHVKLSLRVCSERLLREAPAFMRGESSRQSTFSSVMHMKMRTFLRSSSYNSIHYNGQVSLICV